MRGELQFIDRFEGRASMGRNPGQGAIACVADILGSGRPQVIGGTAVYSWPEPPPGATQRSDCANRGGPVQPTNERERAYCDGELVLEWRGPDINGGQAAGDGYCAVADVLGRDQALAPSPDNPLDGTPELIIVHAGGVQIFNGQTGILLRNYPMGLGRGGGAPNVDDFDGDGFPEIGSAFESGYGMLDLQEPRRSARHGPSPRPMVGMKLAHRGLRVVLPVLGMQIAETVIRFATSRVASVSVCTTAGREKPRITPVE